MTTIVTKFIKRKHSKKLDGKHVMISRPGSPQSLLAGTYMATSRKGVFFLNEGQGEIHELRKTYWDVEEIITTEEP